MKFKLKQPTKYMHEGLEKEDSCSSQNQEQQQNKELQQVNKNHKQENPNTYKRKKIIKKKNQPSATRLNKINQTFQNIYHNSAKLFTDLNIDFEKLNELASIKTKGKCLCDKNVKFYCLKCMQKVCKQEFPSLQLPFEVTVIHHQSQKINKSSALPLLFLTKQTKILTFSSLQEHRNQKLWKQLPSPGKGVYILFPHKESKLLQQIYENNKDKQQNVITNLIILDCTWFQTDQILQILKSKGYSQFVRIQGYKSIYWRYNHHNEEALCSAEALSFFMREYQKTLLNLKPSIQNNQTKNKINEENNTVSQQNEIKKYDNLLFLYCLNLKMILKDEQTRNQPDLTKLNQK